MIMSTDILIKGQPSSRSVLKNAVGKCLLDYDCNIYSAFIVFKYKTKKDAIKALSIAFQTLKEEEPEYYKEGGITYLRGVVLNYDAGKARILKTY